ncbi:hypothetical protein BVX94_03230, partial [bacterium B17]
YNTGKIGTMRVKYPFAVGHEGSGTVVEVGSAVRNLKPGDNVAVEPAMSCGECDQCLEGRPNTCRELIFLGCPGQAEGCLSEYVVMPEACCIPLPENMTLEQAAISEPLAIGVYAVQQALVLHESLGGASSAECESMAVIGSGPVGLSVMRAAKAAGVKRIYMTDKVKERVEVARSAGIEWAGNPNEEDVVAVLRKKEPLGVQVVVECCGQQDGIDQSIELARRGGKVMIVGIPEEDRISFIAEEFRRKELTMYYVRRQRFCVEKAIDMISNGEVDVSFMITHRMGLEDSKQAFDALIDYSDGIVKAMVEI